MSNSIFPQTIGLKMERTKTPIWKTIIHEAASGKETRTSVMSYPRWAFSLSFEFLRDESTTNEFKAFAGFFNTLKGAYDTFLYLDPYDNTVTNQTIGTGDGTTTQYQLIRSYGGFVEPIKEALNPVIYSGGVLQYLTPRTNLITYSNQFNSGGGWTVTNATTVQTVTGPDGVTNSAWYIDETTAAGILYIYKASFALTAGTTYTASLFAKKAEDSEVYFWFANSFFSSRITRQVRYNFDTGVLSDVNGNLIGKSVQTLSNGWVRISATFTVEISTSAPAMVIGSSTDTNTTGSGVYIYGAQLETGTTATPLINTKSSPVTVTDISVSNGVVTFDNAPASGASIVWSGQFYYRCRFKNDSLDYNQFMYDLWEAKKVEFISVK